MRRIRGLTVAAPLKRLVLGRMVAATWYPRPNGRGPIEAVRRPAAVTATVLCIRGLTVAAPLKLITRARIGYSLRRIRGLTVAAPLKRAAWAPIAAWAAVSAA